MKKYTIKEFFKSEEILVVHTPTEEKAIKLLKAFHKAGYKWRDGDSYLNENFWNQCKEDAVYCNDNTFGSIKDDISNYTILQFEDIDFEEEENKMNKNYMEEVAKMLRVEVGEEFDIIFANGIKLLDCPYKFTSENLVDCDGYANYDSAVQLINGTLKIQELPFIPKNGDWYYYVDIYGHVYRVKQTGRTVDYYCIKAGNCFKTEEEITKEIKDRIVKELTEGIK